VIVGVLLWFAPTIISTVQNFFSQSSYTKVTVPISGLLPAPTEVDIGNNKYLFVYVNASSLYPTTPHNQTIGVTSTSGQYEYYPATVGATYEALGLEIKISEVHSDYVVLLVKSL
jgi:hypothetical protein